MFFKQTIKALPSLTSFVSFPPGSSVSPDIFGALGVDYTIDSIKLTPGIVVGVQHPASISNSKGVDNVATLYDTQQTWVIYSEDRREHLNAGEKVKLIYSARLNTTLALSKMMHTAVQVAYSYDRNRRKTNQQPGTGINALSPANPHVLGFLLLVRSRF